MRKPSSSGGRARNIALGAGGLAIGLALLALALRGVDLDDLGRILAEARYTWLVPLVAVALLSHLIRAWRWNLIIASMPAAGGRRPGLLESFGAVLIGYMVNYAAPRLGEVARAGVLARRTRLPFAGLVGTVAAERVLDVITLLLALLIVLVLLRSQLGELFVSLASSGASLSWFILFLVVVAASIAFMLVVVPRIASGDGGKGIRRFVAVFVDGLKAILVAPRRILIAVQTVAIWLCYWMMAWIPLKMLRLTEVYGIEIADAWSVMNIGALGILIPSPGGVGSYHLITVETLTGLYDVHASTAATYAVLTHGVQLVAYVVAGLAALAAFGFSITQAVAAPSPSGVPDSTGVAGAEVEAERSGM